MSDVRWEPVEFAYEYRDGVRQAVRAYGQQLQCVRLDPEGPGYDVWTNITLPPDVRLCRATRVAEAPPVTWSQKPPTEPGWWWRWSQLRGVELHLIEPELGGGELWNATDPEDDMMYPVHRTRSVPGLYWLPATVPQPPGEVGP